MSWQSTDIQKAFPSETHSEFPSKHNLQLKSKHNIYYVYRCPSKIMRYSYAKGLGQSDDSQVDVQSEMWQAGGEVFCHNISMLFSSTPMFYLHISLICKWRCELIIYWNKNKCDVCIEPLGITTALICSLKMYSIYSAFQNLNEISFSGTLTTNNFNIG